MTFFWLKRKEDVSGTSGTGLVAEGVIFSNGWCSLHWLTKHTSVAYYQSIAELEEIHGHNGATEIVYDSVGVKKSDWLPMESFNRKLNRSVLAWSKIKGPVILKTTAHTKISRYEAWKEI